MHGAGFILPQAERDGIVRRRPNSSKIIRKYLNGRDITQRPRGVFVIDTFGLSDSSLRADFPEVYQVLLERVWPERRDNVRAYRRENWWLFGENIPTYRKALEGLDRYIATAETSKHRTFVFLAGDALPDNKLVCVADGSPVLLAILSSRIHGEWALAGGARLEDRPVYAKSHCFDPFPFPDLTGKSALKGKLDELGERLDSFRKARLAEHEFLTMTKLYNVLERVRALEKSPLPADREGAPGPRNGEAPGGPGSASPSATAETPAQPQAQSRGLERDDEGPGSPSAPGNSAGEGKGAPPLAEAERDIYEAGLVGVLKEIHDQIDACVFEAYGWPADLTEEEILERLVALNHERAAEEARGQVRWLRPEFQNPTGQEAARKAEQSEILLPEAARAAAGSALPTDDAERARAVRSVLTASPQPLSADQVAAAFAGKATGAKLKKVAAMLAILEAVGQAETTDDKRWFAGG